MILEGAIGDAYGAGFEFSDRSKIELKNTVCSYETHPLYREISGRYTDDTQMTIALAELMLSEKDWTDLNIANSFIELFKVDSRRGYAKRFYSFLSEIETGEEFLRKIINKSERNGAAMRSYVIGLYNDEQNLIEKTTLQAEVTHATSNAVNSALAIALSSHFFFYNKGRKEELITYLNDILGTSWKGNWKGEVGVSGVETVEAVLSIVTSKHSMRERLKSSVDFGGDVDTVASLVLSLSSMDKSVKNDLPVFLIDDLENNLFGKDYLIDLDRRLINKFNN